MSNKFVNSEMTEEEEESLESVPKKKEKKKKSKEEKIKDRKVIFWVMLIVIIATLGFWMKAMVEGKPIRTQELKNTRNQDNVEIDDGSDKESGFFLKYKI
jgi:cytoskeletal protein RodZ